MKTTKPCARRLIRAKGMICKPPRREPGMSDVDYIKAHRAHRRQITLADCEKCPLVTPVEAGRPASPELPTTPPPSTASTPKETPVRITSERPEKAPGTPPTITPAGTLIYVRDGWEPPSPPPGYHRKSDDLARDDAWVFVRNEPLCEHENLVQTKKAACGCIRVVPTCVYHGRSIPIKLDACAGCDHKGPRHG